MNEKTMLCSGLTILSLFFVIAIAGPWVLPGDTDLAHRMSLQPPSFHHPLGTNDIGQDILIRLVSGTRTSIIISVSVGAISMGLAVLLGSFAALAGGMFDRFILRLTDVLLALPEIVICLLISAYFQPSVMALILLISFTTWQGPLKVIRSQVLVVKQKMSVSAASTFGASKWYLIRKHIVPDIFPLIVAGFIRNAKIAVFLEAGISFLGLVSTETVSWGSMLANAMQFLYLPAWKWWLLPTGMALSLLLLSFSYIGYYLEHKTI